MEEENARRLEYYRQLEQRMSIVRVSDNRADYVISNDDYRRGTPREHFYRKAFLLSLLAAFDNRWQIRITSCSPTQRVEW